MGYDPQYTPFIGIGEIPHLPTSDPNFQRDIQVPGLRYTKKRQTKRRAGFFFGNRERQFDGNVKSNPLVTRTGQFIAR